tara:strand:- start:655 stop:891 length:237 start_codon:yes stop_codon:yes gene_type:complete
MTEEEQKKIFDNTWADFMAVAEKFQKASPENAPSDLVTIMVKFATALALKTSSDSREAYNLIAEAMDSARQTYDQISS